MLIRQDHINLIRKISWSFSQTTCIEWDELFAEASLAYCEAVLKFKNNKHTKISTWAWIYIRNKLIDFLKKEYHHKNIRNIEDVEIGYYPEWEYLYTKLEDLPISDNEKEIIKLTLNMDSSWDELPSKYVRGKLVNLLRTKGWKDVVIWNSIRDLKKSVNENKIQSIII